MAYSWQKSLETQVEAGELKKETTWANIAEVMRGVAERNHMPCLRACRKEVLQSKKRVAESYARLQNAKQNEEFTKECERHRK